MTGTVIQGITDSEALARLQRIDDELLSLSSALEFADCRNNLDTMRINCARAMRKLRTGEEIQKGLGL